ncbi:MAG: SUMF1/EgtB/PvdO family nonheme iron enzyme [Mariprofundaceae bacterium]
MQTASAASWVTIPAGYFIAGSTRQQVEMAYRISAAGYGHDRVREYGWFDHETPQHRVYLPTYRIQKTPVTQQAYAEFVKQSHHPPPFVDAGTWASYRLLHPYSRAQSYNWKDGMPSPDKTMHPVVLVSVEDAETYAAWLAHKTGRKIRLPTANEWEKAMRGTDGRLYPWGNEYDAARLNNADKGPFATMPVGSFSEGVSVYGVLDGAGQVYEWTASRQNKARRIVKGGSWDDFGGICRSAASHSRPSNLKHILIGFRLLEEISN